MHLKIGMNFSIFRLPGEILMWKAKIPDSVAFSAGAVWFMYSFDFEFWYLKDSLNTTLEQSVLGNLLVFYFFVELGIDIVVNSEHEF